MQRQARSASNFAMTPNDEVYDSPPNGTDVNELQGSRRNIARMQAFLELRISARLPRRWYTCSLSATAHGVIPSMPASN
jgi:hypothetical protein